LGGPGSGKGSLCARLAASHGWRHVSLRALLEEEAQRPTPEGQQCAMLLGEARAPHTLRLGGLS
jgi:adenylate kinase